MLQSFRDYFFNDEIILNIFVMCLGVLGVDDETKTGIISSSNIGSISSLCLREERKNKINLSLIKISQKNTQRKMSSKRSLVHFVQ